MPDQDDRLVELLEIAEDKLARIYGYAEGYLGESGTIERLTLARIAAIAKPDQQD